MVVFVYGILSQQSPAKLKDGLSKIKASSPNRDNRIPPGPSLAVTPGRPTLQYDKVFSLREGHQKFTFTEKFLFSVNGAPCSTVLQLLNIKRMDCQRNYL